MIRTMDHILDQFSHPQQPPVALVGLGLVVVYVLYLAGLLAHRLYLSPLAKFPGPKLAALTRWYEAYYEIVLSGQYSFQIDHLHDVYGMPVLPRLTCNGY
jgi:hypothetical protein